MRSFRVVAAAALSLFAVCGTATASGQLVVNGNFEASGRIARWQSIAAGSRGVPGWRVTAGHADVVGRHWRAYDGTDSLEVGTPGAGAVEQAIETLPGHRYELAFAMAGNPGGPPRIKTLDVSAGDTSRQFTFDTRGRSRTSMGWVLHRMAFTASSTVTPIRFVRRDGLATAWWGPAIDAVTVTEVAPSDGAPPVEQTPPAPAPAATSASNTTAARAFAPPDADAYSGLWRAAYGDADIRVLVERNGATITGHTVAGDAAIPTGAIAFSGRLDESPILVLAKCGDRGARHWHGGVLEWTAPDAFHLHVAHCRTEDVLYTRTR